MINVKKALSIMATIMTIYCSTMPIQMCAMEDSNDYEQIKEQIEIKENDSEENYAFLYYDSKPFFKSVVDIL